MTNAEIIRSSFKNNTRESETILGHLTDAIENATQSEYATKDNLEAIREMNYHLMKALTFAENI